MNTVNRVWVVLTLLLAIPLCTILLVFPMPALEAIGLQSAALLDFVSRLQWYVRLSLGILFAVALDIIFILLDDLGKEWVGCYGAEGIETPNVDRLAKTGMKFNNAYSMPQCVSSRKSRQSSR